MADETQAQFQEVLELRVDLPLFQQEMEKVAEVYSSKLQGLGNVSIGTSDVITALKSLEDQFQRLSQGTTKSVIDLTNVMLETAQQVESAIKTLNSAVESGTAGGGGSKALSQEEQWVLKRAQIRQKQEDDDAAVAERSFRTQEQYNNQLIKEAEAQAAAEQAIRDRSAKALAGYQSEQDTNRERVSRLHAQVLQSEADNEQAVRDKSAKAYASYTDSIETNRQRTARLHAQVLDQEAQKEQSVRDQSAKAYARYQDEVDAGRAKSSRAYASYLDAEARQEQTVREQSARAFSRYIEERNRLAAQVPQDKLPASFFDNRPVEEMRATVAKLKDDLEVIPSFTDKLGRDLGGLVAGVIRFQLGWALVGAAVNGVTELIKAPFKAIQEGLEYQRELNRATADLQGVIAANIVQSKDFAENFRQAGVAATSVREQLEEIALKTGQSEKSLQSAFKSLLESGGGAFATNIDQLVHLTELFGLAMRAAGKDSQNTRTLISEIPKLLDGTVASSSKVLEVLHLTKNEWEGIRVSALQHHDLLEQLAPRLAPYLTVVEQAGLRQDVLLEQLGLMKQRIEAAFSGPVYAAYTDALELAKNLLVQNQNTLIAMGTSFADLVVKAIKFGESLGSLSALKAAAQLINFITTSISFLLDALQVVFSVSKSIYEIGQKNPFDWDTWKTAGNDFWASMKRNAQDFADDVEKGARNAYDIANNTQTRKTFDQQVADRNKLPADTAAGEVAAPSGSNDIFKVLDNTGLNYLGSTSPLANQKGEKGNLLQALKEELADRIASIKEEAQEEIDAVTRLEHLKEITSETAGASRVKLLKQQLKDISDAADAVLTRGLQGGLSKPQQDSLTSLVDRTKSLANRSEDKSVTAEEDKNTDKQYALYTAELDRERQAYDAHAKALLAIDKELLSQGLVTNEAVAQAEISTADKVYANDRSILEKKFINAHADLDLKQQIGQDIAALDKSYTDAQILNSDKLKKAREKDLLDTQNYERALRQEDIARQQQLISASQRSGIGVVGGQQQQVQLATSVKSDADKNLATAQQKYLDVLYRSAVAGDTNTKAVRDAAVELQKMKDAAAEAAAELAHIKSQSTFGGQAAKDLTGFDSFSEAFDGLDNAASSIKTGVKFVSDSVNQIQQGFKNGGIAGGIGAILQNPLVGAIPVVGQFLQAGGAILSAISGVFTAAARKIGAEIEKAFSKTIQDYNNKASTLKDTIAAVEQERADAIAKLSGKKGGQDQLDKILPELDQALAQLKQQQKEILDNFQDSLTVLRQSSDVTQKWVQDWIAINKQVKDFLDAGGSAKDAQEFLALELAKERKDLQDQLNQGEQDAIKDALDLNDLLTQRNQLETEYAKQRFDILSADAQERRGTAAIEAGTQLALAKKQHDDQLNSLDQQIASVTQRLDVEKQIFDISSDTATLRARELALELISVDELRDKYLDIQKILANTNNLAPGSNGYFPGPPGSASGGGAIPGLSPVVINVTAGTDADGKKIGSDIYDELQARARAGGGPRRFIAF